MIKKATPPTGGSGGAGDLSDSNPAPVGTAAPGIEEEASRSDHVHAHGNQLGGALHANAGAAAGFMTAADKTKLDAISGTNTGDQVAGTGLTGTTTLNVIANADGSIVANANDLQVGILASDAQHGVRGGGTQHANAVAAGAAGFMTGADKTKLDAISGTNTGDQVAGAGLTGTSTLNVVAHADASIIVNADDIQVGSTLTNKALVTPTVTSPNLVVAAPSSPATGATLFAKVAGRAFPTYRSPSATFDKRLQSHMIGNAAWARPQGYGSATIAVFGLAALTAYDTAVASTAYANTNYRTQSKRAMYASGVGADAIGGWRTGAVAYRSSAVGFYACMRFSFAAIPAQRWAAGLSNPVFVGNAEPSAGLNWVGVGQDSGDSAFIRFMTNDGSGTATKTLTSFATPTTSDAYELNLYSPANSSSLVATLVRLNDGVMESLTISSDLPAVDTALAFHCVAMNLATGTAVNVDFGGVVAEHDI